MNVRQLLWNAAGSEKKRGLPILSFPAIQKMGVTVEQLVKDPELQAQAMALIAGETDTLAAVSLMDLSVEAEAFGAQVRFSAQEIPAVVGQLVSDEEEAEALEIPDLEQGRIPVFVEGVRLAKQRITDKPVIAGMIGPFSLAGRLMDVTEIMYVCYDEPEVVYTVLEKAAQFQVRYGLALKAAGADAIMMAEPLAGILSPDMAEEFSVPYVKRIIDALQDEHFAVIYHNCGDSVASVPQLLFTQGAAAYHFGNSVDMEQMLKAAPPDVLCMGNVDPAGQITRGNPESVREATRALLEKCGGYPNFVASSGCDIPAHAGWDNIQAFFGALKEW